MFGTNNYDSIMEVFTKTVEKLNTRAQALNNALQVREVRIKTLESEQANDRSEMVKCVATANKLQKEFIL